MPAAPAAADLPLLYNMNTLRIAYFALLLTLMGGLAQAQNTDAKEINRKDAKGKPDGLWYVSVGGVRGEPTTNTLGSYDHGEKTGTWYVSNERGDMISIENYKHNVKDGEAQYFENGRLTALGHYRGLNPAVPMDTFMLTDVITGEEKLMVIPTERGSVRHGTWRFYDDVSGRLIREEQYQMDQLIFSHEFRFSPVDSTYYEQRNRRLPHNGGKYNGRVATPKNPTKSFLGN